MTTRTANAPRVRVLRGERSPVQRAHAPAPEEKRNRIRVAAYCRVSTDHEDQETSFEAQQTHFTNLISGNPGWELVGIYADEESGTRAQKRENFMRMIADCEAGKIDMVLSKSISRWARNTLDSLKYIRKLKALEIPIFFTKESINTMDAGGEVLVTILASIAQQESARTDRRALPLPGRQGVLRSPQAPWLQPDAGWFPRNRAGGSGDCSADLPGLP